MPDVRGQLVSSATAALRAQFPNAQVVVEGGDVNAYSEPVQMTLPAAGALMTGITVIYVYSATTSAATTAPVPTEAPATTTEAPSDSGGTTYINHDDDHHSHVRVCAGHHLLRVCS